MLLLLAIPATFLALGALLAYSAYAEAHLISSRALIVRAASHRKVQPEVAEQVVARELERILKTTGI
jgi:hypothetical protein